MVAQGCNRAERAHGHALHAGRPTNSCTSQNPMQMNHADAFYAQVEAKNFPDLKGMPLVVVQYKCAWGA